MTILDRAKTTFGKATVTCAQFSTAQVTSADGTIIGYRQTGTGPGLVIMHGVLRSSRHYERLARAHADKFTVYIPDRHGRGLSGPPGEEYSIGKECEDLATILRKTRARRVFGHNGGGLFALEAALQLPIDRLALYEPAVSIDGSLPLGWLPAYEQAIAQKDYAEAMTLVIKDLPLNGMSKMPHWALYWLFSLLSRGKEGREITELLSTLLWEGKEVLRLDSMYRRYRAIKAETLLLGGSKSPEFLLNVLPVLAKTLPHAHLSQLPGLDHSAPDEDAPEAVATALKEFLGAKGKYK